jgi:hypothetical protein
MHRDVRTEVEHGDGADGPGGAHLADEKPPSVCPASSSCEVWSGRIRSSYLSGG